MGKDGSEGLLPKSDWIKITTPNPTVNAIPTKNRFTTVQVNHHDAIVSDCLPVLFSSPC